MSLGPGGKQPFMHETFIHQIGRPQLLVWPAIAIHLRGKQKGIMQVLKERNLWLKMEGAVMGLVFFLSVQKTQFGLGAI